MSVAILRNIHFIFLITFCGDLISKQKKSVQSLTSGAIFGEYDGGTQTNRQRQRGVQSKGVMWR